MPYFSLVNFTLKYMNITILSRSNEDYCFKSILNNFHNCKNIALPTGNSPLGLYKYIIVHNQVNWKLVKIFMLDVIYPQNPLDPKSYLTYIKTFLIDHINLPLNNFHILNSATKNPYRECQKYEEMINKAGGLDLAILGIGPNGHIAFNEPGTLFDSVTHIAALTKETKKHLGFKENANIKGLTMGLKTIMMVKKIILLAKGKVKAKVILNAVRGPISTTCPASVLQNHPDCSFFLDSAAASLL